MKFRKFFGSKRKRKVWGGSAPEMMRFGADVQKVIGLRLLKLSKVDSNAVAEAVRMCSEKAAANAEAIGIWASGGSAKRIFRSYSTRVSANKRRLSRRRWWS
jgi:hypothetical protein